MLQKKPQHFRFVPFINSSRARTRMRARKGHAVKTAPRLLKRRRSLPSPIRTLRLSSRRRPRRQVNQRPRSARRSIATTAANLAISHLIARSRRLVSSSSPRKESPRTRARRSDLYSPRVRLKKQSTMRKRTMVSLPPKVLCSAQFANQTTKRVFLLTPRKILSQTQRPSLCPSRR